MTRIGLCLLSLTLLAACSGEDTVSPKSTDDVVAQIERLDSVHKTVRLPKDDDFDEMLGMSGGYEHAAVFHDSRLTCPGPSIDCGAVLEVWGDSDDARFRAGYIQELETGMEFLGTEHVFVNDHMVLRVSGDLSRSQADEYNTAFTN